MFAWLCIGLAWRSIGPAQDPEAGVHIAGVDEIARLVDDDAPDLGRIGQGPALGRFDRVVAGGRNEIRDFDRMGRVAGVHDPDPVCVPGAVHVGTHQEVVMDDEVAGRLCHWCRSSSASGTRRSASVRRIAKS